MSAGLSEGGMAYEIEWHTWEAVWEPTGRGSNRTYEIFCAEIKADTMDEIGSAIDEVEAKWRGSRRMSVEYTRQEKVAKRGLAEFKDRGGAPARVRGRWHILWGTDKRKD